MRMGKRKRNARQNERIEAKGRRDAAREGRKGMNADKIADRNAEYDRRNPSLSSTSSASCCQQRLVGPLLAASDGNRPG